MHVVIKNPDPNKGPVKLARHRGTQQATVAAGNAVVITTYFDELCTEPCDIAVDVTERPMFFFIRDGAPVSNTFRLNNLDGDVTVKVKTSRRGLLIPGPGFEFTRLKRARL